MQDRTPNWRLLLDEEEAELKAGQLFPLLRPKSDAAQRRDDASGPTAQQDPAPAQVDLIDEEDGSPWAGGVDHELLHRPTASPDEDAPEDPQTLLQASWSNARPRGDSDSGKNVLRLVALLLPGNERSEWLEEQRGYLADLPSRRARWAWITAQLLAMPRYAYAVRTGSETEPA